MHEAQSSTLRPDLFPFATTPLPHHRAHTKRKKEQSAEKKGRLKNMPSVGCREVAGAGNDIIWPSEM
jgi:hypothetical protein